MWITLVIVVILTVLLLLFLWGIASRYKRCPANKILVIYGATGKGVAKCIHGGAAFVWPIFQSFEWLYLEPFVVPIELDSALSQENIRVSVPTTVTAAISTEEGVMQNAAVRLLGQSVEDVKKQAQDIILGQMRAVIATMAIEDINRDRQAFMAKVNDAVSVELEKIGLALINVNIRDLEDDSGYIEAIGRKAAAEAINQAQIDVAEQDKLGKIGVAERDRDQRTAVAAANSLAAVGEAEAERDKRKAIAAADSQAAVGEGQAARDRRQQLAVLDATAVETEAEANARKAGFQAKQKVAEEEARASAQSAAAKADGAIRVAQEQAQKSAEEAKAQREQARLYAEVVVPAEAAERRLIVESEAEKEKKVLIATGEAEGLQTRMEAEARGTQAILESKALGYSSLVESCRSEPSLAASFLLIEKLLEVAQIQSKAIQNLPLEKIVVWDGGGNGGVSDLGRRVLGVLPPMHELAKLAGLELPEYLGRITEASKEKGSEKDSEKPQPPAGSFTRENLDRA